MVSQKKILDPVLPEDVPPDRLSPLSRKYLDWKTGLVVIIGVLMVFMFLNVLVTNPVVTGLSVVSSDAQESRFSNMTSILVVVFAFFALFLFILTRKLRQERE